MIVCLSPSTPKRFLHLNAEAGKPLGDLLHLLLGGHGREGSGTWRRGERLIEEEERGGGGRSLTCRNTKLSVTQQAAGAGPT